MEELLDVYDKNKKLTGKIIDRKSIELLNDNEYVITVHCFIINLSNQILVTQRSLTKNRGGKWEETHGALRTGETSVEGIKRELKEEIGLDVQISELRLIKTFIRKNKIRDVYILKKNIPLKKIKLNDGEVMNCKYVDLEEFKKMIKNKECTFERFEDTIFYNNNINDF